MLFPVNTDEGTDMWLLHIATYLRLSNLLKRGEWFHQDSNLDLSYFIQFTVAKTMFPRTLYFARSHFIWMLNNNNKKDVLFFFFIYRMMLNRVSANVVT